MYHHTEELSDYIIKCITEAKEDNVDSVWSYISSNFSIDIVLPLWHKLFVSVADTDDIYLHEDRHELYNGQYHFKKVKEKLRKVKKQYKLLRKLPALERILYKQH